MITWFAVGMRTGGIGREQDWTAGKRVLGSDHAGGPPAQCHILELDKTCGRTRHRRDRAIHPRGPIGPSGFDYVTVT